MFHLHKRMRTFRDDESTDALVALQMLEEQEQTREQEFLHITGHIHVCPTGGKELEMDLPQLLKTQRERALYDALLVLIQPHVRDYFSAQARPGQNVRAM